MSLTFDEFRERTGRKDAQSAVDLAYLAYIDQRPRNNPVWCDFETNGESITALGKEGKPPLDFYAEEDADKVIEAYSFLNAKELRALVRRLVKGESGKLERKIVKAMPKPPYFPFFRPIKDGELVRWCESLSEMDEGRSRNEFADDLRNLLSTEVRLIFKDASLREDERHISFKQYLLGYGAYPFSMIAPAEMTYRDVAYRAVIEALCHERGGCIPVNLDAFAVLVEKALGFGDVCNAVKGEVWVSPPALEYVARIKPFTTGDLERLTAGYEDIGKRSYAEIRKRLFERVRAKIKD